MIELPVNHPAAGAPALAPHRPGSGCPARAQEAVDAFLVQPDLAPTSRRSYAQTTGRLIRAFGPEQLLGELVPAAVAATVAETWSQASPRTWNRHLSALGSYVAFCRRRGWPVQDLVAGIDRWREKADNSRVLSFLELDRLWSRENVGLRERCLWRLLYETCAVNPSPSPPQAARRYSWMRPPRRSRRPTSPAGTPASGLASSG